MASAYVLAEAEGNHYRWYRPVVKYYINPQGYPLDDSTFAYVQAAFQAWESILGDSGPTFELVSTTATWGVDSSDNRNTIVFDDSNVPSNEFARTTVGVCGGYGLTVDGTVFDELHDADIAFAPDVILPPNCWEWGTPADAGHVNCDPFVACLTGRPAVDFFGTLVHEIGHVLGLGHEQSVPGVTMRMRTREEAVCDSTFGSLEPDDIAGARFIYPDCAAPDSVPLTIFPADWAGCLDPDVQFHELTMDPPCPCFVGEQITASFTVRNLSICSFDLDDLAVTGRHADGSVWDFPFVAGIHLAPGESYEYIESRVLQLPGKHTFEASYRKGGQWSQIPDIATGQVRQVLISVSPTQPFFAGIHKEAGNHYVFIYPSIGDGTFQTEERIADFDSGVVEIRSVEVADFDQDGLLDVFAALVDRRCYYLHNEGSIIFTSTELTTLGHSVPMGCAVAGDFTSDGYPDVVVVAGTHPDERIYLLRNPGVSFTETSFTIPGAVEHNQGSKRTDGGDIDGDGNLDVVICYYRTGTPSSQVHWLRGDGAGNFARTTLFSSIPFNGGETQTIALGDFNQDRHLDVLIGMDDDGDPGQTWISAGNGDGTFIGAWEPGFDTSPYESGNNNPGGGNCDAYDFNQDGYIDIVAFPGKLDGLYFPGQSFFAFGDSTSLYPGDPSAPRTRGAAPEMFPNGPTPSGVNVSTSLGTQAVTAFDSVLSGGVTTLTLGDPANGPPGQTSLVVLTIATTAIFSDSASVTFPYSQHITATPDVDENSLRLHQDPGGGAWTEIPSILDLSARLLHARVDGLSSFAITGDLVTAAPTVDGIVVSRPRLVQNFPNPFNPSTTIGFTLDKDMDVLLRIYDVRGRLVRTLLSGRQLAGSYQLSWEGRGDDGSMVSSGVYFYRLAAGEQREVRKMVLTK